ncbi:MAG TPA: RelA/SpoT family protein [Candidatus Rikenella faecigallinarum]|uniref:RelA/SpoT family protein n=1 Tax=Candidatus Rikenella faecigallinarum TaxID=2838745 RepID=A0A9D1QBQ7_9BACT|nr:RelA/SpoT family protein [Candidatus Rikenella faecigallinarum]
MADSTPSSGRNQTAADNRNVADGATPAPTTYDKDEVMVQQQFDELLERCASICKTEEDYERIRRAFYFANEAHKGVKRHSGEPYITHPLAVARIVVVEIGLGVKSVMAALLHDVVEDTDYTVEDIEHRFGAKVASMVDGLTKLEGAFAQDISKQAENFKKMLLTLSDDIRVCLIKIADRLHNMRTLGSMPKHKQMKIASETIYLFAPLAHRLGLYTIKTEFEDLSLKYRFPDEYNQIKQKLADTEPQRLQFIEKFTPPIIEKLKENDIEFEISGRVKSVYSIWKKMKRKQVSFEEIYDLFAIRIVFKPSPLIPEKSQCWHVYSLVTDIYKPKPDRIRDWVNIPKANGYEALHCTVMGPEGVWAEVQIRSQRMDEIAERGFAAHWKYKMDGKEEGTNDQELDRWLAQLREALNSPSEDAVEFIDNFKMNLQVSEIVVFTPTGEAKTMPKGATVLDFAYEIHSKIGNHAIGAKVNYKISPLFAEIHTGDQIEILTSQNAHPQVEWLEHITTAKARTHIKQYLKREGIGDNNILKGQAIFEAEMKKLGVPLHARVFRKVLPAYHSANKDEFYSKLGAGIIRLDGLDKVLKQNAASKIIKYWSLQAVNPFRFLSSGDDKKKKEEQGSDSADYQYVMAECCNPIPGDEVVGFKQDDGKVEVHKKNCHQAVKLSAQHGDKIVPVKWSSEKVMSYLAVMEVRGIDRVGILYDLAKIISGELNVNIRELHIHSHDGIFEGTVSLYVRSSEDLKVIMDKVHSVKGVEKVNRTEASMVD